ncbi:MlaD family protein [Conexibacter sp. SYSU D00693]|uniref:MlaD family protein n=1 Tax=Conexibacter sp. SYSU D00693 TaxID=2812560 RepID=UPI00196AFF99|nr:MlaD family protein [Conexibacter sp. SYSU D00693]
MKRALVVTVIAVLAASLAAFGPFGGDSSDRPEYKVVLDNSFGLTEGTDFRATGVRVGSVKRLDVDPRSARAIATVQVEDTSFGTLRRDARCVVEPQSLIGEYYMDCDPGKGAALPEGGTIPVSQTAGTVPPDLVTQIMTRPYRERFGILLSELGAGLASRGEDVNAAIQRAIPALRETDKVLALLAEEQDTLQALTRDADVVVGRLADSKDDVAQFVSEARDTAEASASRADDLRGTIQRFPRFQSELRPVLRDLSTVARRNTPALRDLRASAGSLTTLLERLGPFSRATVPALRSLGEASDVGSRALRVADTTVERLRATAAKAPEPVTNLRFVGEHLDDRANAVEKNPLSPGGQGFTGLEAFLQYPYVQAQAINLFDVRGYTLKLNALVNECTGYTNANGALANPGRTQRCSSALGPNSPKLQALPHAARAQQRATTKDSDSGTSAQPATPQAPAAQPEQPTTPAQPEAQQPEPQRPGIQLPEIKIPGLPTIKLPPLLGGGSGARGQGSGSQANPTGLLDFLLGP